MDITNSGSSNQDLDANVDLSQILLGWNVTGEWDPKYWLINRNNSGRYLRKDLIGINPKKIAAHTAIIGQSGSGKSYFLGRLIEEIILKTKARCVIFDPNADFVKIHIVESSELWNKAKYHEKVAHNALPHERIKSDFSIPWSRMDIAVMSSKESRSRYHKMLKFHWYNVSIEHIFEDIEPLIRSELYHCHVFTKAFYKIIEILGIVEKEVPFPLDVAQGMAGVEPYSSISGEDVIRRISNTAFKKELKNCLNNYDEQLYSWDYKRNLEIINISLKDIKSSANYFSERTARYYFSTARQYIAAGIVHDKMEVHKKITSPRHRIEVVDLPSIASRRPRLLAMSALLEEEMERARSSWARAIEKKKNRRDIRVPTFIIVDEAHNVIPNQPTDKASELLRNQIRTIVAEGRKYGMYIIIMSQRPDKLDPVVLSECENRAILKLSTKSVLENTRNLLGLEDVSSKVMEETIGLECGRGVLYGKWTDSQLVKFYCAARRTVQGGRDLDAEYWAVTKKVVRSMHVRKIIPKTEK